MKKEFKYLKKHSQFIIERQEIDELSIEELETVKEPNYICITDFTVEGEDEPLLYAGDEIYYDDAGKRSVITDGSQQSMIIDWDKETMLQHCEPINNEINEATTLELKDVNLEVDGEKTTLFKFIKDNSEKDVIGLDPNELEKLTSLKVGETLTLVGGSGSESKIKRLS